VQHISRNNQAVFTFQVKDSAVIGTGTYKDSFLSSVLTFRGLKISDKREIKARSD
jgi:hypothetical protein